MLDEKNETRGLVLQPRSRSRLPLEPVQPNLWLCSLRHPGGDTLTRDQKPPQQSVTREEGNELELRLRGREPSAKHARGDAEQAGGRWDA